MQNKLDDFVTEVNIEESKQFENYELEKELTKQALIKYVTIRKNKNVIIKRKVLEVKN